MKSITGWRKTAGYVTATVVLGAIGSGVWELAGKSATQWTGRAILSGVTLGSSAIRDSVYREAAKSYHEAASLYLVGLVCALVSGSWGVLLGYWTRQRGENPNNVELETIAAVQDPQERVKLLEASIAGSEAAVKSAKKKLVLAISIAFFILGTIQFINYLKLSQANDALIYYNQAFAICSPYMSEQDAKLLSSHFAGMQGRDDYIEIVKVLDKVASANGRKLPKFSPW